MPSQRHDDADCRGHNAHSRHVAMTGRLAPAVEKIVASTTIEESSFDVEGALRIRPDHLMALAFPGAGPSGDGLLDVVLTTRGLRRWLRIPARIEFRTPGGRPTGAVLHLQWRARRHASLFPVMEADLMVRPSSSSSAEIVLAGEYRPPLGLFGFVADRVIGSRLAISTAQAFLDDLARSISTDLSARSHLR